MAFTDAYTLSFTLTVNDEENATEPFTDDMSRTFTPDRVGTLPGGGLPGLVVVGFATHEAIVTADLAALGLMTVENIDPTNFVDLGLDVAAAFVPFMRLLPGESYPVRLTPGITLYAQADTGAVRTIIKIYEN